MILAFDTSERTATVALARESQILAKVASGDYLTDKSLDGKGSSTCLAGMIQQVQRDLNVVSAEISAIAICNGPGSFTGLRVGVVTARMLAWSLGVPVVAVNSLDATANALRIHHRQAKIGTRIWSAVNAQRSQLFLAGYDVVEGGVELVHEQELATKARFLELVRPQDLVTGSGLRLVAQELGQRGFELPPPELAACNVDAVLQLALPRLASGDHDDLWTIEPIYFRPSAAEEVRLASGTQS